MDFKIPYRGLGTRRVQLAGTVVASYPGQVHPFDAFGRRLAGRRGLARCFGGGVHSRVFHHALKSVGWVSGFEAVEPIDEPWWRCWWDL